MYGVPVLDIIMGANTILPLKNGGGDTFMVFEKGVRGKDFFRFLKQGGGDFFGI